MPDYLGQQWYDVYNYQPLSFRMTATAPEPRCESGEFR